VKSDTKYSSFYYTAFSLKNLLKLYYIPIAKINIFVIKLNKIFMEEKTKSTMRRIYVLGRVSI
jgi:hypothetical protein